MRYIEVTVNTPAEEIDLRCQQMADMGAGGFVECDSTVERSRPVARYGDEK